MSGKAGNAKFTESVDSLRWSRATRTGGRDGIGIGVTGISPGIGNRFRADDSEGRFSSFLSKINPFGASSSGYSVLPVSQAQAQERSNNWPWSQHAAPERDSLFTLSRWDRLILFGALVVASLVCFVVAFLLAPALALRPRKFVVLWTFGSIFFLSSFAALQGPVSYAKHLFSKERLPFTAMYTASITLTLYFSISLRSTILTLISAIIQVVCLLWYLISYFPMGSQGLSFGTRLIMNRVSSYI